MYFPYYLQNKGDKLNYIITIAGQKGGTGKSTLAMNLSKELSKVFNFAFIDADSRQRHLHKFNLNRKKGFTSFEVKSTNKLENIIKTYSGVLLVDLGGYDSELSRSILRVSDLVIVPVGASDTELDGLLEFENIKKDLIDTGLFYILANKLHSNDKRTLKELKEYQRTSLFNGVFNTVVTQNSVHKDILSTGMSVTEKSGKDHRSYKQIKNLMKEINEVIENE